MNSEGEISQIVLTVEQLSELEKLAAMRYTPDEIALYFDVPIAYIVLMLKDENSQIHYHYKRGILLARAKLDIGLQTTAESGNVVALTALMKRNKEIEQTEFRKKLLDEY